MNDPEDLDEKLALAKELAVAAGNILRERSLTARSSIDSKSSLVDLVTDADKASEAFLFETLQSRRPHDGLIGEEGTAVESKSGYTWVFDPLDGTTNFVYSLPYYSVSIGVSFEGAAVAGAVYNPMLDELYFARTGGGAFCNDRPLRVNSIEALGQALVATGFSYDARKRGAQGTVLASILPLVRDVRRCGSAALDLCHVASGRLDAYFEEGGRLWDVLAGSVIATEAGARVESYVAEAVYDAGGVIAAPPPIFDDLRAATSAARSDQG